MDLFPNSATDLASPLGASLTPVYGDNVQDLLNAGALNVKPTGIIVVNSIDDAANSSPGVTTLRDAIKQANADTGEDLIVFERSLFTTAQTITLKGTGLGIAHNLDIIAPRDQLTGEDLVTVSGNKASRVFSIGPQATVSLDGLIVADGLVQGSRGGSGILNFGTLTLDNSIVRNNSGINEVVARGTIIPCLGGGIYNLGGTLTVSNSTISGNFSGAGGGIFNQGILTVGNSTISGNSTNFSDGGGINNTDVGILTVSNSTISGNSAKGSGGGIFNGIYNDSFGTVTLLFSTVTQNQAANGGGFYQANFPSLSSDLPGLNSVRNTIIASNLNSTGGVNPDVSGTFTSNGYNLIGDGTGSTGFGEATWDIVGTSDCPIDPRLAPLDFYGGSTQTIALLPDSPAIGAADPTVLDTDPTTDQRGLPPRANDGRADIGAFELS